MEDIMLRTLTTQFKHGSVLVRASRVWEYHGGTDEGNLSHIDIVFLDAEGFAMYAEIGRDALPMHSTSLLEGKVYRIKRFKVCEKKPGYMPVDSPLMIQVTVHSVIEECPSPPANIPLYTYRFTKFSDLSSMVGETKVFVDVIAAVTEVGQAEDYYVPMYARTTKRRSITLRDSRNYEMKLYLWGNKAIEFDANFIADIGQEEPVIIIFVGLLVKTFKGNIHLSGNASARWYINLDVPEVSTFLTRLHGVFQPVIITQAEENVVMPPAPLPEPQIKTVRELKDTGPYDFPAEGFRTTITVSRIKENTNWFFASCNRCNKACVLDGDTYRCRKCHCTSAKLKYKICLIGTDGTAEAEFIFFGEMGRRLISRDIPVLMRFGARANTIPPQIASLVTQKYQLTVDVTSQAYEKPDYAYQVRSIDICYGRQPVIPQPPSIEAQQPMQQLTYTRTEAPKGKRKIGEQLPLIHAGSSDLPNSSISASTDQQLPADAIDQVQDGDPLLLTEHPSVSTQQTPQLTPTTLKEQQKGKNDDNRNDKRVRRALYKDNPPDLPLHHADSSPPQESYDDGIEDHPKPSTTTKASQTSSTGKKGPRSEGHKKD